MGSSAGGHSTRTPTTTQRWACRPMAQVRRAIPFGWPKSADEARESCAAAPAKEPCRDARGAPLTSRRMVQGPFRLRFRAPHCGHAASMIGTGPVSARPLHRDADAQPARPWRGCAGATTSWCLGWVAQRASCSPTAAARPRARRPRSAAATASGRMGMRAARRAAASTDLRGAGRWRAHRSSPRCRRAAGTPVARLRRAMTSVATEHAPMEPRGNGGVRGASPCPSPRRARARLGGCAARGGRAADFAMGARISWRKNERLAVGYQFS
jgi:hypothetical protein